MTIYKTHTQNLYLKSILSQLARFDTLDWVAAFFTIATPLYIAYRLIYL